MAELDKVINGLDCCLAVKNAGTKTCFDCPYREKDGYLNTPCEDYLMADALELLKEQAGTGCWEWIEEDKYRCSECNNTTYVDECMEEPQYLFCPYCGHKMTWAGR